MTKRFLTYRALVGFTCQAPVFALFYLANGLNFSGIMKLALAFAGAKILFDVPSGLFADRFGRKSAILLRVALEALSVAVLFGHHFVLSSILAGAAVAFSAGAEQALVYEWHGRGFAKVFGRTMSWGCVSTALAALVGGALATVDFHLVYALRLVVLAAAGVVALTFVEPPRAAVPATAAPALRLSRRLARLLAFVGAIGAVQLAALQLQQPFLRSAGVPLGALGGLYVAFQLATAAGARCAHRFSAPLHVVGFVSAAGLALVALPLPAAGVLALFFLKFAHGVSLPSFGASLNALVPAATRATSLSFRSLFEGSALLVAAPLMGWTADAVSLHAAFAVAAVLALPTLLFLETTPCVAPAGLRSRA
ncbi:MAG: MFS transporter [Planctomycetes bacterium]|nr:MFS transporter [Planctomycetota bacterium]